MVYLKIRMYRVILIFQACLYYFTFQFFNFSFYNGGLCLEPLIPFKIEPPAPQLNLEEVREEQIRKRVKNDQNPTFSMSLRGEMGLKSGDVQKAHLGYLLNIHT